jgi:hypothetical protein
MKRHWMDMLDTLRRQRLVARNLQALDCLRMWMWKIPSWRRARGFTSQLGASLQFASNVQEGKRICSLERTTC